MHTHESFSIPEETFKREPGPQSEGGKTPPENMVSPEEIQRALKIITETLGNEPLDEGSFPELLKDAVSTLPRYREISQSLQGVEGEKVAHRVFEQLKRESDTDIDINDAEGPSDGVLIRSMQSGKLECAGRTLIGSQLLTDKKIPHSVVFAPGHSLIIAELNADTLGYIDTNNNLYFTFPREALLGYQGTEGTSECTLGEYIPRSSDVFEGVNTAYTHFLTLPPAEGTGRQYLGNIRAALNGNSEFEKSGIQQAPDVCAAVEKIEQDTYGVNPTLEEYYIKMDLLLEKDTAQTEEDRNILANLLEIFPSEDDFVPKLASMLDGQLGERIPYIRNASAESKNSFAKSVYAKLINRGARQTITGRSAE